MSEQALQQQIDSLVGAFSGLLTVLASVVATHPHYEHLQLHLASMIEAGDSSHLSPAQQDVASNLLEQMQHIQATPVGSIRPLKQFQL